MKEQIVLLNCLGHPGSFLYLGCKCYTLFLGWTTPWVDDGQINCKHVLLTRDWTTWLWRWRKKNHYCDSCTSKITHSMDSLYLLSVTEYKGKAVVKVSLGLSSRQLEMGGALVMWPLWGCEGLNMKFASHIVSFGPAYSTLGYCSSSWAKVDGCGKK